MGKNKGARVKEDRWGRRVSLPAETQRQPDYVYDYVQN